MKFVLHAIVGLTDVAEAVGSIHIVSLAIDNALVKQGQLLYRSIATHATAWADLALRVRSEIIFRDAIVHMVGQWGVLSKDKEAMEVMHPQIRTLCADKHKQLDEMKSAIELRIMGHYPLHLQRLAPGTGTGPGSTTLRGTGNSVKTTRYQGDVLSWMALNLFRHWLGQHVCAEMNRKAADGGYVFYHALAAGGDKYVDHDAIENFTQYFPLSKKSRNAFEGHLGTLKEGVKPYVHALVQHKSQFLPSFSHATDHPYLQNE